MSSDDVDDDQQKGFVSRVLDTFHTVPCARKGYLYGFSSGLAAGVTTFLFTSRVRRATNVGVVTFALVMPGSFFYCRYQNFKRELQKERAKKAAYVPWKPDESSDYITEDT